jgi:parallel beta-helix repeat protein
MGSFVVGNTVYSNEVQGIYVSGKAVTIENNMISGRPTGITFNVSGSLYLNNRFSLLGTDVDGTATDGGGNISF